MRDGGRGPQMVVVPHGGFQMGAGDAEPGSSDAERPSHYVRFDRGFAMAITEITVSDFERYVKASRSEEHTSELQSQSNLVCRLLLEKKKKKNKIIRKNKNKKRDTMTKKESGK